MKTFDDLCKLGMHDPIVTNYLTLVAIGDMNREEALIGMVFTLSEINKKMIDEYTEHLQTCRSNQINVVLEAKLQLAIKELEYVFDSEGWV